MPVGRWVLDAVRLKESKKFFFEKSGSQAATARNKKLLSVSDNTEFPSLNSVPAGIDESFLLLFSKKKAFF